MADEKPSGETAPAANSKKLIIIFSAVLLLLVGISVGVTWFLLSDAEPQTSEEVVDEAASAQVTRGAPQYLQMKPPFTINLKDSQRVLRVSFAILIYGSTNLVTVAQMMPKIRSAMLVNLGEILADDIETLAGKDSLRALTLETIRTTVGDALASEDIAEVYFTEFVMQ